MIRFKSSEWEGVEGLSTELLTSLRPNAEKAMLKGVTRFVNELKKTLTGKRSGRTYRVSRTGALHTASAEGEPPAVLFGNLRNSQGFSPLKWVQWILTSEVGSSLGQGSSGKGDPSRAYARRLEFGGMDSRGVYIGPRPWMEPTSVRMEPILDQIFGATI